MVCKRCNTKPVWEFTNQTKLCRTCFIDYFERKVFRTVRKFEMMPQDRVIKLKKENTLNYNVLKEVLKKNFTIKPGNDFNSQNLSELAEISFSNIIKGNFKPILAIKPNKPLFFLADREIELYSKLKLIKGRKRVENKRIKELFKKFVEKNPDLEHNIVNALEQLN